MYQMHVMQADKGCEFDFLQRDGVAGSCGGGSRGSGGGEPEINSGAAAGAERV
ncbi:hypothetical protein PSAC2689_190050 [Paraburkholderia sacchari]